MSKYRDRRQKIQDRHQSKSLDDIVFLESGKKIGKYFIFFHFCHKGKLVNLEHQISTCNKLLTGGQCSEVT